MGFASPGLAQQTSAAITLNKTEILIGDQAMIRLSVSTQPGTSLAILTEPLEKAQGLEILQRSAVDTVSRDPLLVLEQRFLITAFDSGEYRIPPIILVSAAADSIATNELMLTVKSLPVTQEAELQPIKDILVEKANLEDFLPYILLVLLIIGLVVAFWAYRHRVQNKQVIPPAPPLTPYEQAIQKLDALAQSGYSSTQPLKPFYSELTYILREYLENQFHWPALESTTREIERELAKRFSDQQTYAGLVHLLRQADLIKFAKASPQVNQQADLNLVRSFVEATHPHNENEA